MKEISGDLVNLMSRRRSKTTSAKIEFHNYAYHHL